MKGDQITTQTVGLSKCIINLFQIFLKIIILDNKILLNLSVKQYFVWYRPNSLIVRSRQNIYVKSMILNFLKIQTPTKYHLWAINHSIMCSYYRLSTQCFYIIILSLGVRL